jgi:aspartyl-tRNA(Asn)/glutamyl-tRNA(Gln) amidotransferase subunit A
VRERELSYLSAAELGRRFRARELSPVEVTRAVLHRIERVQPLINAFVLIDAERALASAKESELRFRRGESRSLLEGVPVSLKDLLLTKGWATRRGSRATSADGDWSEDSPAAARLREGGAVLLGKTTTSEFGLKGMGDCPLTGITRNPWQLSHTPGGSSAGAVAAIAAGLGAVAVGTDGGGSIRVPAAYSGVVGLKPSFGRVPTHPASVVGVPPHVGPIARTVEDAGLLLDVLSGADDRDPFRLPPPSHSFGEFTRTPARWRIGYLADGASNAATEVGRAFIQALERCREVGLDLVPLDLSFVGAGEVLTALFQARAAHTLQPLAPEQRELVDPVIRAAAAEGARLSAVRYLEIEAERAALAQRVAHLFRQVDLFLTPSTAEPAPSVDAEPSPHRAPFTGIFSLSRNPALSLPIGNTAAGLPMGLQIVGRHFEEAAVLALAAALERPFLAPPEG